MRTIVFVTAITARLVLHCAMFTYITYGDYEATNYSAEVLIVISITNIQYTRNDFLLATYCRR